MRHAPAGTRPAGRAPAGAVWKVARPPTRGRRSARPRASDWRWKSTFASAREDGGSSSNDIDLESLRSEGPSTAPLDPCMANRRPDHSGSTAQSRSPPTGNGRVRSPKRGTRTIPCYPAKKPNSPIGLEAINCLAVVRRTSLPRPCRDLKIEITTRAGRQLPATLPLLIMS
jgi:hypothetical protein